MESPAASVLRALAPAPARQTFLLRLHVLLGAVLAVAAAWLLFVTTVLIGACSLALIPPLAPVFAVFILGNASLISSAHDYAQRAKWADPPNHSVSTTHERWLQRSPRTSSESVL